MVWDEGTYDLLLLYNFQKVRPPEELPGERAAPAAVPPSR